MASPGIDNNYFISSGDSSPRTTDSSGGHSLAYFAGPVQKPPKHIDTSQGQPTATTNLVAGQPYVGYGSADPNGARRSDSLAGEVGLLPTGLHAKETPSLGKRLLGALDAGVLYAGIGGELGALIGLGCGATFLGVGAVPGAIVGAIGGGVLGFVGGFAIYMLATKPDGSNPQQEASGVQPYQPPHSNHHHQLGRSNSSPLTLPNNTSKKSTPAQSRHASPSAKLVRANRESTAVDQQTPLVNVNGHFDSLEEDSRGDPCETETSSRSTSPDRPKLIAMPSQVTQPRRRMNESNQKTNLQEANLWVIEESDRRDIEEILKVSEYVKNCVVARPSVEAQADQFQQRAFDAAGVFMRNLHDQAQSTRKADRSSTAADHSSTTADRSSKAADHPSTDAQHLVRDFANLMYETMLYSVALEGGFDREGFERTFLQLLNVAFPGDRPNDDSLLQTNSPVHVLYSSLNLINQILQNDSLDGSIDQEIVELSLTTCEQLLNALESNLSDTDSDSDQEINAHTANPKPSITEPLLKKQATHTSQTYMLRRWPRELPRLANALKNLPLKQNG